MLTTTLIAGLVLGGTYALAGDGADDPVRHRAHR
jgi:hypothetical protein